VKLVLGTRGSALALAQVALVEEALRTAFPGMEVEVRKILTSGDETNRRPAVVDQKAGVKGLYTKEIQQALMSREIDAAVHSLKDVPGNLPEETTIGGVLERADSSDVLISKAGAELAPRLRLGTSSIRRRRQLEWLCPGIHIEELRGNVPTRLRKLRENDLLDGIVLAQAGLSRLAIELDSLHVQTLPLLPALGQGVIALEHRRDDGRVAEILAKITHQPTLTGVRAERELLRLLDGDCNLPVGAKTKIENESLHMSALVFDDNRSEPRRAEHSGPINEPEVLARAIFDQLYES